MASETDVFKNYRQLEGDEVIVNTNSGATLTFNPWRLRLSNKIIYKLRGLNTDKQ